MKMRRSPKPKPGGSGFMAARRIVAAQEKPSVTEGQGGVSVVLRQDGEGYRVSQIEQLGTQEAGSRALSLMFPELAGDPAMPGCEESVDFLPGEGPGCSDDDAAIGEHAEGNRFSPSSAA